MQRFWLVSGLIVATIMAIRLTLSLPGQEDAGSLEVILFLFGTFLLCVGLWQYLKSDEADKYLRWLDVAGAMILLLGFGIAGLGMLLSVGGMILFLMVWLVTGI